MNEKIFSHYIAEKIIFHKYSFQGVPIHVEKLRKFQGFFGTTQCEKCLCRKNFDKVHFFYQALLFIRSFTLCSWFLKSTRNGQPSFIRQPRITSD